MKRLILIALAVPALMALRAQDAAPVAVVTSAQGETNVLRAGSEEKEPLAIGAQLYSDDMAMIGADGSAIVYFLDGGVVTLAASERLILGESAETSSKEQGAALRAVNDEDVVAKPLQRFKVSDRAERMMAIQTPAGFRGEGVIAVAPSGFVYDDKQWFVWIDSTMTKDEAATREYVIVVVNDYFEEVQRVTVSGVSPGVIVAPVEGLFEAQPGGARYYWDVYPKGAEPAEGAGLDPEAGVMISSLGEEMADLVETAVDSYKQGWTGDAYDEATFLSLSGMYLKDKKLYSDALEYYYRLLEFDDDNPNTFEELAHIFSKLGKSGSLLTSHYAKLAEKAR
ncbi:MAG: hypothetical protein GF419_08640 [Ignavibacteriales bacterium]|nr:hypothetical protein [Ignavibacteriales bacterium]